LIKMKIQSKKQLNSKIGVLIFLVVLGAFMALPLLYSAMQAFKPAEELFLFPPRFFVRRPSLGNFKDLVKATATSVVPFGRYVFNTVFSTIVITVTNVVFASLAGFSLGKGRFPGSNVIIRIIITSLLFTSQVTGIIQYVIMSKLYMVDTYWAVILPHIATPMSLFLMVQFMGQVPDSLIEAARIDGAGLFKIWYAIVMPNVRPAWLTLTMFAFQSSWSLTSNNLIYSEELKMLPSALTQITTSGVAYAGAGAASVFILMLPPIIIFTLLQSSMIQTMAHSGIKG